MITPLPRFYYHWSLVDFVGRYALLIDGLPTIVLLAAAAAAAAGAGDGGGGAATAVGAAGDGGGGAATAAGDGGGAGNMPLSSSHEEGPRPEWGVEGGIGAPDVPLSLLQTCQLLLQHLIRMDKDMADDTNGNGGGSGGGGGGAAAYPAAKDGDRVEEGGGRGGEGGEGKTLPSNNAGMSMTLNGDPTDHPSWHLSPTGVYLRTHAQWVRLENYRAHRAHTLVTRIQGAYRRHWARRVLRVGDHTPLRYTTHTHTLLLTHISPFLTSYYHLLSPNITLTITITIIDYPSICGGWRLRDSVDEKTTSSSTSGMPMPMLSPILVHSHQHIPSSHPIITVSTHSLDTSYQLNTS